MDLIASVPADYLALIGAARWRGFAVPEGGLEPVETLQMLHHWSVRLIAAQGWGAWLAVTGGEVVASMAIKDPVQDGVVELGYGVAPARRGRGHATAAVALLLPVLAGRGVRLVRAETAVGHVASGRVLIKTGFPRSGGREDAEDGFLDLWERDLQGAGGLSGS